MAYGGAFDRPSAKSLKRARNEAGERLFERDELRMILDALDGKPVAVTIEDETKSVKLPASAAMKAMVLLGLNAGFGNTDCASLPRSAVNLDSAWLTFPRPKTEVQRRRSRPCVRPSQNVRRQRMTPMLICVSLRAVARDTFACRRIKPRWQKVSAMLKPSSSR